MGMTVVSLQKKRVNEIEIFLKMRKSSSKTGMMEHVSDSSIQEAEAQKG